MCHYTLKSAIPLACPAVLSVSNYRPQHEAERTNGQADGISQIRRRSEAD